MRVAADIAVRIVEQPAGSLISEAIAERRRAARFEKNSPVGKSYTSAYDDAPHSGRCR
jgi:hypothetical protein